MQHHSVAIVIAQAGDMAMNEKGSPFVRATALACWSLNRTCLAPEVHPHPDLKGCVFCWY
jgi:hypothetical protein